MVVGGSTAKISRQASQNLGKYLLTILLLIARSVLPTNYTITDRSVLPSNYTITDRYGLQSLKAQSFARSRMATRASWNRAWPWRSRRVSRHRRHVDGARKWRRFAGGRGPGSRGNAHSAERGDGGRWSCDGGRLPDGRHRQRQRQPSSRRRHEEVADVGAFQQGDRGPEGVDSNDHLG